MTDANATTHIAAARETSTELIALLVKASESEIASPCRMKLRSTLTGMPNPRRIGVRHVKMHTAPQTRDALFGEISLPRCVVSMNL